MAHCLRSRFDALLLRTDHRIRRLRDVLCPAPAQRRIAFDHRVDWLPTALGFVFLCASSLLPSLPNILTETSIFNLKGSVLGRIFDAYGPRVVLIPGSILLVFSTMLTSVCVELYQFLLVQGLLTGLAYGML